MDQNKTETTTIITGNRTHPKEARKNLAISITACNRIDPKDITVIDGARLGLDLHAFYAQLDSLMVPQESFYTKTMTRDLSEVLSSQIKFYRTDLFNTSKYSSSLTNHYGTYYPMTIEGTKNVVGVNILLVHADNALVFTDHPAVRRESQKRRPAINGLRIGRLVEIAGLRIVQQHSAGNVCLGRPGPFKSKYGLLTPGRHRQTLEHATV